MKLLLSLTIAAVTVFADNLKELHSFEANFDQTVTNASDTKISYKGELYIKKPSSILWKYRTPVEKQVFLTNNEVIIVEPELEQVIVSTLQKGLNIVDILNKAVKIDQNIYEAILNDTKYILTFENEKLKKIDYKDEVENKVVIDFSDVKSNRHIPENIFRFDIPDDYDVIRK